MKIIFILILIILLIIAIYFGLGFVKTSSYQGPTSDHFDGKKFFNADKNYKKKSTGDILKWWFSRNRQQWPAFVENTTSAVITPVEQSNVVRVTFVNHSSLLVQTKQFTFLTDPVWSERTSPFSWAGPKRVRHPGIAFDKLPQIDVVLISHNHYDHLDINTLIQLDKQFHPLFLVPLGNKSFLEDYGIHNVIEMDWWQQHKIKEATITFLPTKHWSSRWMSDKFQTLWGSFGIEVANKKIFFAGDSGYGSHFIDIKTLWGKPDVAFLPIGSYKPEWFMRDNHLNPEEAVKSHLDLQAKYSIAIHFNTFQLSDEAIDQPSKDLQKALHDHQLSQQEFMILNEGQSKDF